MFHIPGFKKRVLQEFEHAIDNNHRYKKLSSLRPYIKAEKCIYPPNILVWIGASLLSSLNQEIDTFLVTRKEFEEELDKKLPDRFGHCFITCSRNTEVVSSEDESDNEGEDQTPLDDKFKVPETKRELNYFNKGFEELNQVRKDTLYSSATPYSTRGVGSRPMRFHFPQ